MAREREEMQRQYEEDILKQKHKEVGVRGIRAKKRLKVCVLNYAATCTDMTALARSYSSHGPGLRCCMVGLLRGGGQGECSTNLPVIWIADAWNLLIILGIGLNR